MPSRFNAGVVDGVYENRRKRKTSMQGLKSKTKALKMHRDTFWWISLASIFDKKDYCLMRRILHEGEFFFYLLNVDAVLENSSTQDSIRQQFLLASR